MCTFEKIKLSYIEIGPFIFIKNNLKRLSKNYDVIIFEPSLHNISYIILPFINVQSKLITWSIGIRASYTRRFNLNRKKKFLDYLLLLLYQKSDAIIVYTKQAISFWSDTNLNMEKIFVAHNTVTIHNQNSIDQNLKDSILFIGTLYPQKQIGELLKTYSIVFEKYKEITPKLLIIGEGPEESKIKKFILDNKLSEKIKLLGGIYEEEEIKEYFNKSLICVSPDQAGLSVLKSMGYGVPFVTRFNAITGGEIFNIENNVNGFLYTDESELIKIIESTIVNKEHLLQMGEASKLHYANQASPDRMVKGVLEAIEYSIQ